jgi:hypothetical protein
MSNRKAAPKAIARATLTTKYGLRSQLNVIVETEITEKLDKLIDAASQSRAKLLSSLISDLYEATFDDNGKIRP